MTPTPVDLKLQRFPAHAPHIRSLKGPRTRRAGDAHTDRVELAALPRTRPAHPWFERATDAARENYTICAAGQIARSAKRGLNIYIIFTRNAAVACYTSCDGLLGLSMRRSPAGQLYLAVKTNGQGPSPAARAALRGLIQFFARAAMRRLTVRNVLRYSLHKLRCGGLLHELRGLAAQAALRRLTARAALRVFSAQAAFHRPTALAAL